jgi:site-specific recombinase XerD
MGVEEVRQFLSDLAVHHHVAASTQNQALSAILFLYQHVLRQEIGWIHDVVRAKKPKKLPVVFTQNWLQVLGTAELPDIDQELVASFAIVSKLL